ncbi:MAG: hotdog domain-containing protein [Planctomycetota bacterium]|nr:hotdog domain-containing protein [Planctomycetota bacterium]
MDTNSTFELLHEVAPEDLAKSLTSDPGDDFPEVFATSRMVAVMELAAARLMQPLLSEGQLSVGVDVHVTHMAPTPVGEEVRVVARFTGRDDKLYLFEVELHDRGGLAGKGTHSRAIVVTERLVAGAKLRIRRGQRRG